MKLLVTGGAGFIGTDRVQLTARERPDVSITVLDAMTYVGDRRSLGLVEESVRFVDGDVTDAELVDTLVEEVDAVVHFGAESHNDNSLRDPWPFVQTNAHRHNEKFIPRQINNLSTGSARVFMARASMSGTGATSTTTIRPCGPSLSGDRIGETYRIGADGELSNCQVVEALLEAFARPGTTSTTSPSRPGPICGMPSIRQSFARRWAGSRGTPTSPEAGADAELVPRPRGVAAAAMRAIEAKHAASGQ